MFLAAFSPYDLPKTAVNFPLPFTQTLREGWQHPKDCPSDTGVCQVLPGLLDARDQRGRLLVFNYSLAGLPSVPGQGREVAALVLSPA